MSQMNVGLFSIKYVNLILKKDSENHLNTPPTTDSKKQHKCDSE